MAGETRTQPPTLSSGPFFSRPPSGNTETFARTLLLKLRRADPHSRSSCVHAAPRLSALLNVRTKAGNPQTICRCNPVVMARLRSRLSRRLGAVLAALLLSGLAAGAVVDAIEARALDNDCLATKPNGYTPPGVVASPNNHGEGALMVGLWTWPSIDDPSYVRQDAAIGIKLGWWRVASGQLTLAARRTDGAAPPPHTSVGSVASYGDIGFVPSSLLFATRGCYEVVGRLKEAELRFVVRVDVGREQWVPPETTRPSVRVRNGVASIRWTPPSADARLDAALRRGSGPWRLMRKEAGLGNGIKLRPRLRGRYAVRIRAHDDFGAGQWSPPAVFRIR